MARVLVPLKKLAQAKMRLAGMLTPIERQALALAMVRDVLSVLSSHEKINGVTLVSDDSAAVGLARTYGIDLLPERSLGC